MPCWSCWTSITFHLQTSWFSSLNRVMTTHYWRYSPRMQIRLDMHQNIYFPPDLAFPFSHSSRLLKTMQFSVFLSYEENRKQKRRFFPVMLFCKSSPMCVACSSKEVCNHWVWGNVFRGFISLQLLLVSSFKIFLWQNYSHLSLVSEAATCKCSDCQEVLLEWLRN